MNTEHRTSNAEHRITSAQAVHWMFEVRCSVFDVYHPLSIFKRNAMSTDTPVIEIQNLTRRYGKLEPSTA